MRNGPRRFWALLVVFGVLVSGAGILLAKAPVLSDGVIAEGTNWEARYHVIDSGEPGPTVMVTGGVHGNEPAGARAAEQIRHWPIVKGRLVVLPRANGLGLAKDTRFLPGEPKERRDLNRNFHLADGEVTTAGVPATAIWKLVQEIDPDWVLDLHEGMDFHVSHRPGPGKKRSVGSSVIYFGSKELDPLVTMMLEAANAHVSDPDRRFVSLKGGSSNGSLLRACVRGRGAQGMILETTFKDQPLSLRTREHRAMVNVALNHLGVIDRDCSSILAPRTAREAIQIGFYDGPGTGPPGKISIPRIADGAAEMDLHFIGPVDVCPEVLAQFDLLVFPGGSGSKQAKALGLARREFVRDFVKTGGGYLGICAGAYLASAHYSWSLDLVDASVFTGAREIEGVGKKQMWYRGNSARVEAELSDEGAQLFPKVPKRFDVRYQNGPIISPKGDPELEDYKILAWFRSEQVRYPPQKGTMIDTPAIVSSRFGDGRVISISPHPESDKALGSMIVESVRWVAR